MLRAILKSQLDKFERHYRYDATYMRDVLAVSPWTLAKFLLVSSLGKGRRAPAAVLAAAGIVGTLAEDCGPCTQISVDMATEGGVPADTLRAILAGERGGMGEAVALVYDFARAVLARDMEEADPLRDEIVRRWGKGGLVDISLSLTTARMYPTLKYGLGYGKTCSKVVVAGAATPFHKPMEPRLAA